MSEVPHFRVADYVVLSAILVTSLGIGLYYVIRRRIKSKSETSGIVESSKEYFAASQGMGVFPASVSILASALDSVWYMGVPSEFYFFGFHFWADFFFIPIVLGLVAHGVMPVFYKIGSTSANQYLERRFNTKMRRFGSLVFIFNTILYVSLVTYVPAMSITHVTGVNLWTSVSLMCVIGTIYTAMGGIRAVMWTDVFQMLIIYLSMMAIVIKGSIELGGAKRVIDEALDGHRLKWATTSLDVRYRYNIPVIIMSSFTFWAVMFGTSQTQLQRYMTCPTKEKAARALWVNIPGFTLVQVLVFFIGLIMYASFKDCDPLLNKEISKYDELLPHYVMRVFKDLPGLPGLFVAGVFSGALSTLSSCLNSMAAVTLEDFVLAFPKFKNINETTKVRLSKTFSLSYGFITIPVIILAERVQSVITFMLYNNGLLNGTLAGVFFLGLFFPIANTVGTTIGIAVGGGFVLALVVGSQVVNVEFESEHLSTRGCLNHSFLISSPSASNNTPLYRVPIDKGDFAEIFTISPYWMQTIAVILVMVIGVVASFIYSLLTTVPKVDLDLLSPFVTRFMNTKVSEDTKKEHTDKQTENTSL